jgi:hypothetical protein
MYTQHIILNTTIIFYKTFNFKPWEIGYTDLTLTQIGWV